MSTVIYDGTRPDDRLCVVSAYAVRPSAGSEPGVGFAFVNELQRHVPVLLYTEAQFISETCKYAITNRWRVRIICIALGESARQRCWNQGRWSFYFDYWVWQIRVAFNAFSLDKKRILGFHHLNMIGFREPGYLWLVALLKRRPFSIGPLGGANYVSPFYYSIYGPRFVVKQAVKNVLNVLSFLIPRVQFATVVATRVYICSSFMLHMFRWGLPFANMHVLSEVFVKPEWLALRGLKSKRDVVNSIEIALIGKDDARKGYLYLPLVANEVAKLCDAEGFDITINYQIFGVKELPSRLMPNGRTWSIAAAGILNIEELKYSLLASDALLHLSIDEGTPNAVLEAASAGLPVIIYNGSGAADILKGECYLFDFNRNSFISDVAHKVFSCVLDITRNNECKIASLDTLEAYLPEETTRKIFSHYYDRVDALESGVT